MAKQVLEEAGYMVTVCHDGRLGLEVALSEAYDLCLLNAILLGLMGYGIAVTLQGIESQLPLIVLTSCNKCEVRNHLAILGVTAGYLGQAFQP